MAQVSGCTRTVAQLNQITGCTDFDDSFLLLIVDTINGETMSIPVKTMFDCMGDDNYYLTGGTYSGGYIWFSGIGTNFSVDVSALLDDTNTYVTGATLSGNTLILERNDGINIYTDLSSLVFPAFSGGSGSCITDLYVTNIHGCSPVTLWNGFKSSDALAVSENSFAFGTNAVATGNTSFVFGDNCKALEFGAFTIGGSNTAVNVASLATGEYTNAYGTVSATFGYLTSAYNTGAVAFGRETQASGEYSAIFGYSGQSIGKYSFGTGWNNEACGYCSFTEGGMIIGRYGYPESDPNYAIGNNSHAGGHNCVASGASSYAFGSKAWAYGTNSRALGFETLALGNESIAINCQTQAIGDSSFASGQFTKAIGWASYTGGWSDSPAHQIVASGKGTFNFSNYHYVPNIDVGISGVTGDFSAILGGDSQSITGQFSFIGGGQINSIWDGMYSAIIGGENNNIQNHKWAGIFAGSGNTIDATSIANICETIIGGHDNYIDSSEYSSIIGGHNNRTTNLQSGNIITSENCVISGNADCFLSTIICSSNCEINSPSFYSRDFYLGGQSGSVYNSSGIGHIITNNTKINNTSYLFLLNSQNIDGDNIYNATVINTDNLYLHGINDSFISNSFNITLTGGPGNEVTNTNIIGCKELNFTGPLVNSVLLGISSGTITPVSNTTYVENLNIHTQPQNDDTATSIGITSDGFIVTMSGNNSMLGDILYFAPEYPNAVFAPTDGSNDLIIETNFDSTNLQNYYGLKAARETTGDQETDIFLQLMVPLNFTSWNNSDISFKYWFSGGTLGTYELQVYDTTNTSDFSTSGFINSESTWSTITFDTMNGTYIPGQPFIVRIRPIVEQAQEIKLGSIRMRYNT